MPGTCARTSWGTADTVVGITINAALSGSNTIVAAVAGRRIVVLFKKEVAAGAVSIRWESSGGLILSGPCSTPATGGAVDGEMEGGHFATLPGEALLMNLGGAVQVGGHLKYALV
jgi:hypothetical protein